MFKKIFFLTLVLSFVACSREQSSQLNDLIVGRWQLVNFSTNQKIIKDPSYKRIIKQMILTTSIDFYRDGRCKSYIWGSKQNGYWKIKADSLIVLDKNKKDRFTAKILKLNNNQLVLYWQDDTVKIMLYFRKDLLN